MVPGVFITITAMNHPAGLYPENLFVGSAGFLRIGALYATIREQSS